MKKIMFASVAALLFSIGAIAQTTTNNASDKKQDMKDLRQDVRDLRQDKIKRKQELKEGDKADAKALAKDMKNDRQDIRKDTKDLKEDGVKHPMKRVNRQLHRANHKHA